MDEQPSSTPTWSWPERYEAGKTSQPQSPGSALESSQLEQRSPQRRPYGDDETSRALAIRSMVITLTSTILSGAASFGLHLDEAQSTAVVSVVAAIAAIVVLVKSKRGGSG